MNHGFFDSTRLASKLLRAAQLVQGKEHLAHDSAIPKINSTKTQKNKKTTRHIWFQHSSSYTQCNILHFAFLTFDAAFTLDSARPVVESQEQAVGNGSAGSGGNLAFRHGQAFIQQK